MHKRVSAWCALPLLLLCGCSLFVPKLEPPKLSILNIQLLRSDLWHQDLRVRMRVENPNDRKLPVRSITYTVDIEGQEFAHGESASSFVVPPLGEAEFDMTVSANMAGMLVKLLGQGGSPIEYHLSGKVALSEGLLRSIPFDNHGTFKLQ
ncbi:MAG TPA: LEA type 2 family protein [Steroidobacteraceae bacterium]|nr:LEA type 2 family protein [Steroidobacteraceae bacterium]